MSGATDLLWPPPTMRSLVRTTVAAAALVAALVAGATVAVAEDLPPGFTDGRPVGEEEGGPTQPRQQSASAAATTERYFGREAYEAVRAAVQGTSRSCYISDDGLTALVLAPVFKESSAATTPSTAPAPMTLSRYDEWTGTYGTSNNQDANYGLYAFRNPYTKYSRAYWHPGIGIWQYDSAGLGSPFTAVERMHVGIMAGDVARITSSRYCSATGSDQDRRYTAWTDWGYPCTLCQGFFNEMVGSSPKFANLNLVNGITPLGGTVARTCSLPNTAGTVPCWYVEPRVGVIQGSTAWATLSPTGGNGPTVAPAPLSHPFYVVDRGATEERHWLQVDTGYDSDIRAVRTIGKNARPRSNQTGSGLAWTAAPGLCDLTAGRGACYPVPPAGMSSGTLSVASGYRPVALDANGDGAGDVLWYRPGSASDALWIGSGGGRFGSYPKSVNGTYDHVLPGDVDGDGDDDVLWYASSTGAAFLWRSDGGTGFSTTGLSPGAGRIPLLLDVDGDEDEEIFWYGPGSVPDSLWQWTSGGFQASARSVSGVYQPIVGEFDGNARDDIFWYAPGSAPDFLWLHTISGGHVSRAKPVRGTFRPLVGDYDGDRRDDIFWYAPGSAADYVWFGASYASFASHRVTVNGSYQPFVASLDGSGRDSMVWYAPGTASDFQWSWSAGRALSSAPLFLPGQHRPTVGAFSTGGGDGVLWYEPAKLTDVIWFR